MLILLIEAAVHKLCGGEEDGAHDDHPHLPVHAHKEVGEEVSKVKRNIQYWYHYLAGYWYNHT